MPCIPGKRILLRELRDEDFQAVAAWQNNRKITRFLGTLYWYNKTEQDVREYMAAHMEGSHNAYYFVIADIQTEDYLGEVKIYSLDWRLRSGEIAIVVASPGKGIGQEALKLVKEYAFQTLGLERLFMEAAEDNHIALHCYEKAGFIREGVKRHGTYYEGAFHDVVLMSALRGDRASGE